MFAIFWTDETNHDHYVMEEDEADAKAYFEKVHSLETTRCAGYAPVKDASEPHWVKELPPKLNYYAFDFRIFTTINVRAETESEARELLKKHVDFGEANFGSWPDGDPILGQVTVDDPDPTLIEVNGDPV